MLKITAYNFLILFVGLLGIELIFGTWFSDTHALYKFTKPRNIEIERINKLPTGRRKVRYVRDQFGFRGLSEPVSKIDILTVGGSTTDQRYLDETETYQSIIKKLSTKNGKTKKIAIANAGIDGQSTVGHIHNFKSWFNEIHDLKVRYILFYVGINDLLKRSAEANIYDTSSATSNRLIWQLWVREKSALYQLYYISKQIILHKHYSHEYNTKNFATGKNLTQESILNEEGFLKVRREGRALTSRIRQLSRLSKEMGATPIFVTQRSVRWVRKNGKVFGIKKYQPDFHFDTFEELGPITGVDIYNIERVIADSVMEGCHLENGICLDLLGEVDFNPLLDFYDPIHTTASGSEKIGKFLAEKLRPFL